MWAHSFSQHHLSGIWDSTSAQGALAESPEIWCSFLKTLGERLSLPSPAGLHPGTANPRLEMEAWARDQRLCLCHRGRQWRLVRISGQRGNDGSPSSAGSTVASNELFHQLSCRPAPRPQGA